MGFVDVGDNILRIHVYKYAFIPIINEELKDVNYSYNFTGVKIMPD